MRLSWRQQEMNSFFINWRMNVNFISIMQCTSGLVIIGVLYMQCVLHFIFGSIWASGELYMRFPFMQGAKDAYDHYFVAIKIFNWPKKKEKSNTEQFNGWSVTRHFSPMWRRPLPVRISGIRNVGAPYVNVIWRSGCFNSRVHNHAQKLNHILGVVC